MHCLYLYNPDQGSDDVKRKTGKKRGREIKQSLDKDVWIKRNSMKVEKTRNETALQIPLQCRNTVIVMIIII